MTWASKLTRSNIGKRTRKKRRAEAGFSLLELLMVTGIIGVLSAIAIPVMGQALTTAETKSLLSEGRTVHTAFKNYFLDHNEYPATLTDLVRLSPLSTAGYYRGAVGSRLDGGSADAYGSPDDLGQNQEFWLEMTLATDQSVRILVCDSDDAPLSGGEALDGVYVYVSGVRQSY